MQCCHRGIIALLSKDMIQKQKKKKSIGTHTGGRNGSSAKTFPLFMDLYGDLIRTVYLTGRKQGLWYMLYLSCFDLCLMSTAKVIARGSFFTSPVFLRVLCFANLTTVFFKLNIQHQVELT